VTSAALSTLLAGLLFGLSLIVAIGAQNTFVLQQGLLRRHVTAVVAICAASDVALIGAGVAGASVALDGREWLLTTVRIAGAAFLLTYAALAVRRLGRPAQLPAGGHRPTSAGSVIAVCLAFTWLNPAVYLDTVVLLGSVANSRGPGEWWFGLGAALGSIVWFVGLGFGARLLTPLFARRAAWRALDGFVAVVMTITAGRILLG